MLRVQVFEYGVGFVNDTLCQVNYLSIDGVRYCRATMPPYIQVPKRQGGLIEIAWLISHSSECNEEGCAFDLQAVDTGEPKKYRVSPLVFKKAKEYDSNDRGVLSISFQFFATLLLVVWSSYIYIELGATLFFLEFIVLCPSFPHSKVTRVWVTVAIGLPRLALALWVYWLGVMLLITSSNDYITIVLNSVALAFILDIDEYLFMLCVPVKVKAELADTEPFLWPARHKFMMTLADSTVPKVIVPVIAAMAILALQYNTPDGYSEMGDGIICACGLSGEQCTDAILRGKAAMADM